MKNLPQSVLELCCQDYADFALQLLNFGSTNLPQLHGLLIQEVVKLWGLRGLRVFTFVFLIFHILFYFVIFLDSSQSVDQFL